MKMAFTTAAANLLVLVLQWAPQSRHNIDGSVSCSPLWPSSCGCRTCQRALAEQQILRYVVHGRTLAQALLGGEGKAQQQSSAAREEDVGADKDHHQLGRHGGGGGAPSWEVTVVGAGRDGRLRTKAGSSAGK